MRWVLTRTVEEGEALAQRLKCALVPCVERVELDWPSWPVAPLVFVTSKAAAARLAREWPHRPSGTTVAAVSPATSAVLSMNGIPVDICAVGGAVALANAVRAANGAPVALSNALTPKPTSILYPTSDAGLRQPEQEQAVAVLSLIAPVSRHAVYSVRAPDGLAARLAALGPCGFVFFSPSAVEHVAAANVIPSAALCIGASTLRACDEQRGWPTGREVREEELPGLIQRT